VLPLLGMTGSERPLQRGPGDAFHSRSFFSLSCVRVTGTARLLSPLGSPRTSFVCAVGDAANSLRSTAGSFFPCYYFFPPVSF